MRTERVVCHQLRGNLLGERGLETTAFVDRRQLAVFSLVVRGEFGPLEIERGLLRIRL